MHSVVTTIKFSRTVKVGGEKSFNFDKVEAEIVVPNNQNENEAFTELVQYVNDKLLEAANTPVSNKSATPAPPLAKSKSAQMQEASQIRESAQRTESIKKAVEVGEPGDDAPFDVDSAPPAEPGPPPKKRGRKPKNAAPTRDAARKEYKYVLDAESLEELFERLNNFRKAENGFVELLTLDQWAASLNAIHSKYKSLMTTTADPDVQNGIIAALKGERNALEHKRQAQAA